MPKHIGVTGASNHDGKVFDQIRQQFHNHERILTPVKKRKRQRYYLEPQNQWLSTTVSRVRQPYRIIYLD
ncbi:hypothetical protein [Methylobacter sp. BBA5.1]|uniref:hypothetical protein n=1 Tax=Methylobacter sp. BBA5.1 TaxID=1495064 RepID=UPI0005648F36|nr:hypothetical protein [Methylobacter sp. BBA5.1]